MKTITLYQAVDGSNWPTEAEALKRDALCSHVDAAMSLLKPRPTDIGFSDGDSYVQQEPGPALTAKQRIVDLAYAVTEHAVFANNAEEIHPRSVAGFILDEVGGPLAKAWSRFSCIDSQYREWGQLYFVNHPNTEAVCATSSPT
jgi:hypothetical protein